MPTKFLVICTSGVSSYGNAKAEIILVKMRQGVKEHKKPSLNPQELLRREEKKALMVHSWQEKPCLESERTE